MADQAVRPGALRAALARLAPRLPQRRPATGWYFADAPPPGSHAPGGEAWECMFSRFAEAGRGTRTCFAAGRSGCRGAEHYLGFAAPARHAAHHLTAGEGFKRDAELAAAFYAENGPPSPAATYLVVEDVATMAEDVEVRVVNLWVDARSLGALVTLANFDRPTNDNVVVPFASGCQSTWTLPYRESFSPAPRAVVGCMDPATRPFLPPDTLSFSVCAGRFLELARQAGASFLTRERWGAAVRASADAP
jgi:hypothetical protein